MDGVDYFSDLRIDPQAAVKPPPNAPPAAPDYFADLRVQPAPRQPSRGFIGEITNQFMGTLIKENPKLAGASLEGLAELMEPGAPERAGAAVGGLAAPPGTPAPPPETSRLRQLATALQEYGKTGEAERRPAVPSFWDIRTKEGLGTMARDAVDYIGQAIGMGGGSAAPSIAAGVGVGAITKNPVAGFIAGAFGPSYIQNFGDTYSQMRDDKDIQAAIKAGKLTQKNVAEIAAAFSVPMAALDTVQAERVFGAAAKELKGNLMKRALKRAALGIVTEAPTEGAQQAMQEAALDVGGGQKSWGDQAKAVVDAFIQGGISAGPISALHPGPRAPEEGPPTVPPGAAPAEAVIPPETPPPGAPPGGGPPAAPAPTLDEVMRQGVADEVTRQAEAPASPRLTPEDHASPIPSDIIDAGKAAVEQATGQPSTFTTTSVINGKREVVTGKVADLVAANQAQTQAVVDQIMQGVSVPQILTETAPAAPPARTTEVAGTPLPTEAAAAPAPAIATPEAGGFSASGKYSDGTDWSASYTPVPRTDGTFALTRNVTDSEGTRVEHLLTDGTWAKGEPARTATFGQGLASTEAAAEVFDTTDRALASARDDATDMGATAKVEAPAPAAPEPASIPGAFGGGPGIPLSEQIKRLKARRVAYDAEIAQLASTGKSIRMESNRDPTHKVMIGPDMSEPGKYRVTYFDAQGPSGHTVHNTLEDAARDVMGSYHPVGVISRQVVRQDSAVTPSGREVPVTYAVVEAGDLVTSQRDEGGANPAYPQELQPRDRSRGTSDQQINQIAQNLDPRLLDNNASATDGAPIISADGVVESGNGRVLAIRRAYSQGLPGGQTYRQYLEDQGYPITGMQNPVLVRIRQGQLEQGERAAFTREANERTTLAMSATERAMADAAAMSPATIGLFRGGEISEAGNRDFVRSFLQSVVSPNEQGAMVTPDGGLSQEAIRRVQAALLARAFGDPNLVGALVESPDVNIKAIGSALMDVAGPWAQMRSEAADGSINPEADITPHVLEAVRLVQRARNEGKPLSQYVSQTDIFSGQTIAPEAEAVLRLMFRNTASWTMPAGREKLAEALRFYVTEARKTSAGIDLLGEKPAAPAKILEEAKRRQYGAEETQAQLALGGRVAGEDTGAPSAGRAVEAQPRPKAEGRPSPAPKAPAPEIKVTLPGGQTAVIEHPDEETFRAVVDGKRVGQMNLTLKRSAPYATSVTVEGPRRIGIATALYDAAEKVLGRRLIPSPLGLSDSAIAFWKNRLSKMEPEEKQALLAESLKVGQEAGVGKSARQRVDQLGYREPAELSPEEAMRAHIKAEGEKRAKAKAEKERKEAAARQKKGEPRFMMGDPNRPVAVTGTGPNGRILIRDVGQAFTDEHLIREGEQLFPETDQAHYERTLAMGMEELERQLEEDHSGVGWYSDDVQEALDITSQIFPKLTTDSLHRKVYLTLAGIFSNGTDPDQAWQMAADAYRYFNATGQIPVQRINPDGSPVRMTTFKSEKTGQMVTRPAGWGKRSQANEQQLALLNYLAQREGGLNQAIDWLLTRHPRTEINRVMTESGLYKEGRFTTKASRVGDTYGFLAIGEKLGRYSLGLHGIEVTADDTTVDLWYTRSFRRWTGRLLETPVGAEGVAAQPANDRERSTIFRITGDLARRFHLTAGDVQAALWFFEKRLWRAHGIATEEGTNSQGARRLVGQVRADEGARGDGSRVRAGQAPQRGQEARFSIPEKEVTARAEGLAAPGTSIRMVGPDGNIVLVSGDMQDETKTRITYFDAQGKPVHHRTFEGKAEGTYASEKKRLAAQYRNALEKAAAAALREGNEVATIDQARVADAPIPYETAVGKPNVVNAIDPSLSDEDKAAVLTAMSAENIPIVNAFMKAIDEEFGTLSEDSEKRPARILEKSQRPSIRKEKPWFRPEHIRDSYRFRTRIPSYEILPKIIRRLEAQGIAVIKYDVAKVENPGEYGWRVAAFDLYMPNGQLVEYYLAANELMEYNNREGHQLFENWRNKDEAELSAEERQRKADDINRSYTEYTKAWNAYLARSGDSLSDIRAWLSSATASSSESLSKFSKSPPVKPLRNQVPSRRYAPNLASESTTTMKPGVSRDSQALTAGSVLTTELTSFPINNVVQPKAKVKVEGQPTGGVSETQQVVGGQVHYALSEQFRAVADKVTRELRRELDRLGLTGVNLKVWQQIFADLEHGAFGVDGLYLRNMIDIALNAPNKLVTLHHEALHAMRALGVFTDTEWSILERKSKKDWITDEIKANYPEAQWAEEGVAYAFQNWMNGARMDGVIAKSFKKINLFMKAIYKTLTGNDIRSAEDIFHQISAGEIGGRSQGRPAPRTAAPAKAAVPSAEAPIRERIDAAIAEVYSTLFPNPLNSQEVGFANKEQTAVVMMQLENYGTSLYVKWLSAFPQKGGMGTQGMDFLKGVASKYNVPLTLTPWARGELGTKKLTRIFKQWGFKPGPQGLLRWTPEEVARFSVPSPPSGPPTGPNDPRFHLQQAPHSAQQAQQVTQGFLSRGQPVDRAIRVGFNLLGGLDQQGRWRPGKRLSDKLGPAGRQGLGIGGVIGAGIGTAIGGPVGGAIGFATGGTVGAFILRASPNPKGKFGWFAGIAENAKKGLIDGYGLDPAYIEAYRKSELGKAAIMREAQGILKVLSNAGVGTTEAKVLQAVLTGENVTDADMIRLSVPIRKAIDDLGAEAVSLGLISAESYQRNRGAYLHRIYVKNEVDQSTLAGWVSAQMAGRRKRIIGDELKGRGMFWDVPADRLMRDVESFQKGTRGAAVLGEKFHVIDEVSATPSLTPGGAPTEKTLRRVYLPANEAVPAKYQGPAWVDRGQWEVRKAGKTNTLWRDYTKAERDKMGELVDARYTIAKTFMLMANDLSTGRFFKEVSEKQEWTSTKPPAAKWKDASEYNRYWEDPEIQWVKVPDTNIADTGGKKRWGALAGKYVRAEIWRDLNEVNIANNPGTWRLLLTQWKKNKTGRNPVVHMNNIMSNVMFMDLADVRAQDLAAGIKAFFKGDANYQEALDNGAFGGDMVSQEIRDQVFKPILDEIAKQTTGAGNPFLKRAGIAGAIADKLWTWAKTADNGMLRAYQAEDQLFRMATYMRRRSQGESPQTAAQNARDQFLNYDIRAPWIVAMRNSLFPFISYTYRAVPKLAENIMHRPWKLAKYFAVAYAVNALAYMLMGEEPPDEEKQRAALRDEEQGWTWIGVPRMVRMPWRDANGLPVFLDIRRWIPAGDIFDTQQGSSALPIPAPLHFGGPLQMAFEFMLNRQAFTGQDITNDLTMDNSEKFSSVADWAWKSWAPASFWTPNSWYWTKISNALYGATDTAGHPYSVTQAFLSSLGIKLKPLDVDDGIKWHFYDFKKEQDALKQELRAQARRLERGLISQSAFDSAAANLVDKNQRLGERVQEFGRRISGER